MTDSFEIEEIEGAGEIPTNFHLILVLGYQEMPEGVAERATRKAVLVDLRGLAISLRDSKFFGLRVGILVNSALDQSLLEEVLTQVQPMHVTVFRFKQ